MRPTTDLRGTRTTTACATAWSAGWARLVLVALLGALGTGCLKTPDRYAASTLDVKVNPPASFELDGQPFCFAGSNNYYPLMKPRPVVDDLFEAAVALDMRVMRIWGMMDRGSLDRRRDYLECPFVGWQQWSPATLVRHAC